MSSSSTAPYSVSTEMDEPRRLLAVLRGTLVVFVGAAAIAQSLDRPSQTIQVVAQVVVLAIVAVLASTRGFVRRLGLGAPIVEAVVASAAAVAVTTASPSAGPSFLPYILVPCLVAGLRGGLVWALATVLVSEALYSLTFLSPRKTSDVTAVLAWAVVGVVVGGIGAYVRSLEARRAHRDQAYVNAHRLLTELWLVARQLSAGLDPVTLAHATLESVRERVPFLRAAVFVRSPGGFLVPLAVEGTDTVDWDTSSGGESLLRDAWTADSPVQDHRGFGGERHLYRAGFPLRMGVRTFGVVAMELPQLSDVRDLRRAMQDAEESALRLETALLFADVRSIASSEERRRLAREIHDGVAQELTSLGYTVDDLIDRADEGPLQGELHALRREVTRVISELRLSIFDLRTDVSGGSGLGSALSDYVQQIGAAARGLTIHLVLDESPQRLRSDTEVEVLRIAQEAITNARKHAQADNLWVTARVRPPDASIEIEDDGVGFGTAARSDSFGMHVMRERAQRIGARLSVEQGAHRGTRVTLSLGSGEDMLHRTRREAGPHAEDVRDLRDIAAGRPAEATSDGTAVDA